MELNQIRCVLELAECKSFTKAANNLSISQPAISYQIKILEEELDTKLFKRDTHGVSLTNDGEKFCYYGQILMDSYENLKASFDVNKRNQNKLKVGLYMFYKVGNLSNIILDYIVSSNIMVKIIAVETTEAYEMIKNNLLDFAL